MDDRITCPACGFQNGPGDEFCGQCGRYLGWSADAPGQTTPRPDDTPTAHIEAVAKAQPTPPGQPTPAWGGSYLAPQEPPRYDPAPPAQIMPPAVPGGVACRTCGLTNPPGRTFCQRCGNELDPAIGTVAGTPRPVKGSAASGGSGRRIVAAGVGLIVVAAVAGAAIVFGGVLNGPAPSATPRTAIRSPSATPPTGQVTDEPFASPTGAPTTRPTARPTRRPTAEPGDTDTPTPDVTGAPTPRITPRPTRTPNTTATPTGTVLPDDLPTPPPAGTYLCAGEAVAIEDPMVRGWNIERVRWGARSDFDHVYLELGRRRGLDGVGSRAVVQVMPVSEVAERLGFVAPSTGRTALVLTLSEGVRATLSVDQVVGLQKVRAVTAGKDPDGLQWLVLGVRGDACYSLQAPAWSSDVPTETSSTEVIVDVAH